MPPSSAPWSEGRRIYDNIRKAIQFLLASNMSEVLGVFVATLLGFTLLNPVHLLFINLMTDCFPALALGMEKAEPDVMQPPPRDRRDGIFAGGLGCGHRLSGPADHRADAWPPTSSATAWRRAYFEMPKGVSDDGMTMAFLTMSMCGDLPQLQYALSAAAACSSLPSHNKVLWLAHDRQLCWLTTVVLRGALHRQRLRISRRWSWTEYGIALGLAVLVIPVVEIVEACQRRPWPEKETALSLSDHIRRGGFCRPGALSKPYKMPGHRPAFFFLREFAWRRKAWYNYLL